MEKLSSNNKQEIWLNHIKKAQQQKQTLAAYAKQHQLSDKSIYRWKKVLTQRGLLTAENTNAPFVKVIPSAETSTDEKTTLEITLSNGHHLSLKSINQTTLLAVVNTLRSK